MPEDAFDVPVPNTVGEFVELLRQYPPNLPQVNHKDENPCNNCADNLEWCTELYNHNYGTYREKHRQNNEHPIMFRGVRYRSIKDCARRTGHTPQTVKRHCERISI